MSVFDRLVFEAQFQELSPGGGVSYVRLKEDLSFTGKSRTTGSGESANIKIPAYSTAYGKELSAGILEILSFVYENTIYAAFTDD